MTVYVTLAFLSMVGALHFAHFLQFAMISFAHFLRFPFRSLTCLPDLGKLQTHTSSSLTWNPGRSSISALSHIPTPEITNHFLEGVGAWGPDPPWKITKLWIPWQYWAGTTGNHWRIGFHFELFGEKLN